MKKLSFLLIILSLSIIFGACPPLEEDDQDSIISGNLITFDEPFELDVDKWFEILDAIAKERKYVSLDLSKGTYKEGNTAGGLIEVTVDDKSFTSPPPSPPKYIAFDPFPAAASGKDYILSIILPDAAQMVNQAIEKIEKIDYNEKLIDDEEEIENIKKKSAFRAFTNLRSVKADRVTLIGNFAFADCTALKELNFPRLGHTVTENELSDDKNTMENGYRRDIGKYAFMGCTDLKEVKFNSAAVIGEYAFKDCTSLEKIDFPEAWMIENNAFEGCKNLVNVFFEKASKIGEGAFKNCTGLKKAEFNVMPKRFTEPKTPLENNPCVYDSVIFYPSAFNGCKALEVLNVSRAWNVYFYDDVLANTNSAIEIYLFDDDGNTNYETYGHPQDAMFLGNVASAITLKKINLFFPLNGEKILRKSDSILEWLRENYKKYNIDVNPNPRAF